jgi:hypothetical protein
VTDRGRRSSPMFHTCAWVKDIHKLRVAVFARSTVACEGVVVQPSIAFLPDEQRCVTVNSLEVKYTQHSYNILHDRRARGEHSRLVGAVMPPYMAPPVLNRCNSRFGCQHHFCLSLMRYHQKAVGCRSRSTDQAPRLLAAVPFGRKEGTFASPPSWGHW